MFFLKERANICRCICLQRREMAHLEFCIPATSRDELVQSSKKKAQYVVRSLLNDPAEIEQKVEGRLS